MEQPATRELGADTGKVAIGGSRNKPVILAAFLGGGAALALVLFLVLGGDAEKVELVPSPAPSPDMQDKARIPDQKVATTAPSPAPDIGQPVDLSVDTTRPQPLDDKTPAKPPVPKPRPAPPKKPSPAPRADVSDQLARAQEAFKTAQALNIPKLYQKALNEAHHVLRMAPRNQDAVYIVGASACQLGDDRQYNRARELLGRARRADLLQSCPQKKQPSPKPAIPTDEQRKEAANLASSADKALRTGQMLSQPALLNRAQDLAKKALKLDPTNQRARYVRAAATCLQGNHAAGRKQGASISAKFKSKLKAICNK